MVVSEMKEKDIIDDLVANQPIPSLAQPEEIANLSVILSSANAEFITGTDVLSDRNAAFGSPRAAAMTLRTAFSVR